MTRLRRYFVASGLIDYSTYRNTPVGDYNEVRIQI